MKKLKNKLRKRKFIKKCPMGGYCVNPLCMVGCVG